MTRRRPADAPAHAPAAPDARPLDRRLTFCLETADPLDGFVGWSRPADAEEVERLGALVAHADLTLDVDDDLVLSVDAIERILPAARAAAAEEPDVDDPMRALDARFARAHRALRADAAFVDDLSAAVRGHRSVAIYSNAGLERLDARLLGRIDEIGVEIEAVIAFALGLFGDRKGALDAMRRLEVARCVEYDGGRIRRTRKGCVLDLGDG